MTVEQLDGCQACGGERPMTWMITHLSPPVTVQSCEQDIQVNLITTLASLQDVDPSWLYEVIAAAVNEQADQFAKAKAADERKAKRRLAKSAAESAEDLEVAAEVAAEFAAQVTVAPAAEEQEPAPEATP